MLITKTNSFPWRFRLLLIVFILSILVLAGRTLQLHLDQGDFLREEGAKRTVRQYTIPAYRGLITDRNGVPLAVSTPVTSIWINPKQLISEEKAWPSLANALDMSLEKLNALIQDNQHRDFLYVRRHLDPQAAALALDQSIPGVYGQTEYKRYYPAGEVTAHLLGLTDIDDNGQEGLELAFDERLKGRPGVVRIMKDRRGNLVKMPGIEKHPEPGLDVALSIDLRMQYLAHKALAKAMAEHNAKAASLVALDVESGKLLAMVNQPAFNPNNRSQIFSSHLRNRAVTDVFEPGSTVKPFTVAAALAAGTLEAHTPIDTTPGYLRVGRKTIRDMHNYGLIDVEAVLTKSSNVGATKIALDLAPEYLTGVFSKVGLGSATGVGFPGERSGRMPAHRRWREIELATLSYGYGVSVTTLQLAQAYAVLANRGVKTSLSILRDEDLSSQSEQALPVDVAKTVVRMLETVVGDEGTAKKAQVPGYKVGGKTGTVHKLGVEGYAEDRYMSLFAGFAPVSDPKIVLVVVVDEPRGKQHFGGLVAAPVFAQTMGGMLRMDGVPMDAMDLEPRLVANVSRY